MIDINDVLGPLHVGETPDGVVDLDAELDATLRRRSAAMADAGQNPYGVDRRDRMDVACAWLRETGQRSVLLRAQAGLNALSGRSEDNRRVTLRRDDEEDTGHGSYDLSLWVDVVSGGGDYSTRPVRLAGALDIHVTGGGRRSLGHQVPASGVTHTLMLAVGSASGADHTVFVCTPDGPAAAAAWEIAQETLVSRAIGSKPAWDE